MNPHIGKVLSSLIEILILGLVSVSSPAFSQAPRADIGKEEYKVVSVALGKRAHRTFIAEETSDHGLNLRDRVHASPTSPVSVNEDPSLRRPRREPDAATKRWIREEEARMQDAELFRSEILDETIDDWMEKNTTSYQWMNRFELGAPTVVITQEVMQQSSGKPSGFWEQIGKTYPDITAIEEASRVGFNRARTQAVILVGFGVSPVGGEGEFILLKKQNGAWKISHRMRAWLS